MTNRVVSLLPHQITRHQRIERAKIDLAFVRTAKRILRQSYGVNPQSMTLNYQVNNYGAQLEQVACDAVEVLRAFRVHPREWKRLEVGGIRPMDL